MEGQPVYSTSIVVGEENTLLVVLQNAASDARCAGSRCSSDSIGSRNSPRRRLAVGFFSTRSPSHASSSLPSSFSITCTRLRQPMCEQRSR